MFNIQGSELIFLLLVALIVLGPEKLPDAMRRFGKAYGEFKKMANGFQGELRSALDEPMRELRDTADVMMKAAQFDVGLGAASPTPSTTPTPSTPAAEPASTTDPTPSAPRDGQGRPQSSLNFGGAAQRSAAPRQVGGTPAPASPASPDEVPEG